jgi:hypothetical protein
MNSMREPKTAERNSTTKMAFEQIVVLCGSNAPHEEIAEIANRQLQTGVRSSAVGTKIAEASNSMHLRGGHWFVQFEESDEFTVPASVGMRYISLLLPCPYKPIDALHLLQLSRCLRASPVQMSRQDVLDYDAMRQMHQRLVDAKDDLSLAKHNGDNAKAQDFQREIERIQAELRVGQGLNGQSRCFTDEQERARKSVSNAIKRAVTRAKAANKFFGIHLQQVYTGCEVSYQPALKTEWEILM